MTEDLDRRVEKLEDKSDEYIKEISVMQTEIGFIRGETGEIKETVQTIQKDLINGERESLKEFNRISKEFQKSIGTFKEEVASVVNQRHECKKEEDIGKIWGWKRTHELSHTAVNGESKGVRKVLYLLWIPVSIACYVLWDKCLAKLFYRFFN